MENGGGRGVGAGGEAVPTGERKGEGREGWACHTRLLDPHPAHAPRPIPGQPMPDQTTQHHTSRHTTRHTIPTSTHIPHPPIALFPPLSPLIPPTPTPCPPPSAPARTSPGLGVRRRGRCPVSAPCTWGGAGEKGGKRGEAEEPRGEGGPARWHTVPHTHTQVTAPLPDPLPQTFSSCCPALPVNTTPAPRHLHPIPPILPSHLPPALTVLTLPTPCPSPSSPRARTHTPSAPIPNPPVHAQLPHRLHSARTTVLPQLECEVGGQLAGLLTQHLQ